MLTIPSGSVSIIDGAAFVVREFVSYMSVDDLQNESTKHLKLTASKSRSMARYGVPYTLKGRTLPTFEWTPFLNRLRVLVQDALGVPFNAAVVNLYANAEQYVPMHSDAPAIPQLGKEPVIAGVSFGMARPFVMKGLKKVSEPIVTEVGHGDLLVMYGNSQSHYRHGVPAVTNSLGYAQDYARWSVTFRHHVA